MADNEVSKPNWVERHTTVPMLIAGTLGVLITLALILSFDRCWCVAYLDARVPHVTGMCGMIRGSPPWLVLTGLTAAPSVLLTWYWRTSHRKRELHQKQRELDLKDAEIAQARADAERESETRARLDMRAAFENLDPHNGSSAAAALVMLERLSSRESLLGELIDLLCVYLRSQRGEIAQAYQDEYRRQRQRVVLLVASLRNEAVELDLQRADLSDLRLSGLNLRNSKLQRAKLDRCEMFGTLLANAKLSNVHAAGAKFDDTTEVTAVQAMILVQAGAAKHQTDAPMEEPSE
jgi:uncharacterized protein YjbI with pentapeptide repeats